MLIMSRYRMLGPWLAEAKRFWQGGAGILVALVVVGLGVALCPSTAERTIRLTGLVLQLLGIWTVIWGIRKTRALLGHPPIRKRAMDWLRRFPLLRRDLTMTAAAGAFSTVSAGSLRGHQSFAAGPDATVESRLDALEKNIPAIHERITSVQKELDQTTSKLTGVVTEEQKARQAEDAVIARRLEETSTGGVDISLIGALWLFVGVLLSTAAPEVEALVKARVKARENIVLCCIGCTASKGAKTLTAWLQSSYCQRRGISKRSVADVVRAALAPSGSGDVQGAP